MNWLFYCRKPTAHISHTHTTAVDIFTVFENIINSADTFGYFVPVVVVCGFKGLLHAFLPVFILGTRIYSAL